ncbi:DUF427 domain-containing protein [Marinitenerispora sediminis]|uniref:DUF427 domain-containing protein n=1 Tax=Marinitenerispora sediminis TaxID=1931232 RepID=A0A368T583_9ACTN|nr:DUF427 domain-containing protein [Marinitenerispora sediminis]RCV52399.1 hypothetical protein DEF23_19020 [Marinitenerispora sediminis]RCV53896.1 hypothetical protein DEF28_09555 [Marinitenerispora sediminis]RCV58606.1 hypothetical protein DEF24_12905 [Marinitenerispora sediminis]
MSLTFGGGPLAGDAPATVNYRIDGPAHELYMHPFPRRVRAEVGGQTVLDTEQGHLLHETGLTPVLYVPWEDIKRSTLTRTDHTTHCPFKGDAAYWTLSVGSRLAENAVWAYPEPKPAASWLRGLAAMYWDAADAWYDEEERVRGHLRDPFHRVDTRQSSKLVRVALDGEAVATTGNPKVLSETGLPNRYYLPPEDVRRDLLVPSRTKAYCPYKGAASYWSLRVGDREVADVAWSYQHPLKDAQDVRGYFCFLHDDLAVTVEHQPEPVLAHHPRG